MSRIPGSLGTRALAMLTDTPPNADVIALLERAKHDLQHGWKAAALDALRRALNQLENAS